MAKAKKKDSRLKPNHRIFWIQVHCAVADELSELADACNETRKVYVEKLLTNHACIPKRKLKQ